MHELVDEVDRSPDGPTVGAFFDFDGTLIYGFSVLALQAARLRRRDVSPQEVANALATGIGLVLGQADYDAVVSDPRPCVAGPHDRRHRRDRPQAVQAEAGRTRVPRGASAGRRPPAQGPHRRAGVVRAVVPGRGDGRRPRHRARALHALRGGRRQAHRPARRSPPLGRGQAARGRAARDRAGRRPRRELRLRRRQRGRRAARAGRQPAPDQPDARARTQGAADAAGRCTGSHGRRGADARPRGAPRRRARRVPHRHRHRHRPRHPQPEQGRRGQHDDLGRQRPRARHRRHPPRRARRGARVVAPARGVPLQPPELHRSRAAHGAAAARRHRGGQEGARRQPGRAARRARSPTRCSSTATTATARSPRCARSWRRRCSGASRWRWRPEGTRSGTGRLGPFKKGAFRLAMAGGVPVVPIVFRNANDVWPLGTQFMRPGTVDVVVHPPIPTDGLDRRRTSTRTSPRCAASTSTPSRTGRCCERREGRRGERRGGAPRPCAPRSSAGPRSGTASPRSPATPDRPIHDVTTELDADLREMVATHGGPAGDVFLHIARLFDRTGYRGRIQVDPDQIARPPGPEPPLPGRAAPEPPLLHRPGGAGVGAAARRPAADLQARRHQRGVLAHGSDGAAGRSHLHPAQLPRRPGVQARAARVRRLARRTPPEPRVVHRGRSHPHRQAARPATRTARLPRRRGARRAAATTSCSSRCRSSTTSCSTWRSMHGRCTGAAKAPESFTPAGGLRAGAALPLLPRRHPRRRSASRSRCATTSPASSRPAVDGRRARRDPVAEARVRGGGAHQHRHSDHSAGADHHGAALGRPRAHRRPAARAAHALRRVRRPARDPGHVPARSRRANGRCAASRRCSVTAWSPATTMAARSCTSSGPSSASRPRTTATASSTSSSSPRSSTSRDDGRRDGSLHDEALALRDLFKFEFFFEEKGEFLAEVDAEVAAADRPVTAPFLRPFLEAYWATAEALAAHGDEPVDGDDPRGPRRAVWPSSSSCRRASTAPTRCRAPTPTARCASPTTVACSTPDSSKPAPTSRPVARNWPTSCTPTCGAPAPRRRGRRHGSIEVMRA